MHIRIFVMQCELKEESQINFTPPIPNFAFIAFTFQRVLIFFKYFCPFVSYLFIKKCLGQET